MHGGISIHGQSIISMPRVRSRTNKLIRTNNGLVKGMKKRGAESSDTVKLHMMKDCDVDFVCAFLRFFDLCFVFDFLRLFDLCRK